MRKGLICKNTERNVKTQGECLKGNSVVQKMVARVTIREFKLDSLIMLCLPRVD